MMFGRFLHVGMSRCGVQMSLRCAEVAPGAKPSVEGDDGADWCVVDAGKPLHFLLIKLACLAVPQPQPIRSGAHALARARAYQNVSGFLPDEYVLQLKRGVHVMIALWLVPHSIKPTSCNYVCYLPLPTTIGLEVCL